MFLIVLFNFRIYFQEILKLIAHTNHNFSYIVFERNNSTKHLANPPSPSEQFPFPFGNQKIFDLCCSHYWCLIFLPHQIRPEVHHELQIFPNTKLGDKNWSPPDQILRRMGYICPRPWRGLVKLKISWITNTKRNYHRSENEPLTDSYHEHFYVEKGFKVSDIDLKLAVLESVDILKPPLKSKLIT